MRFHLSKWIESIRKDVECVFGIMKARHRILRNEISLHDEKHITCVFMACAMLHNMLIDDDGWKRRQRAPPSSATKWCPPGPTTLTSPTTTTTTSPRARSARPPSTTLVWVALSPSSAASTCLGTTSPNTTSSEASSSKTFPFAGTLAQSSGLANNKSTLSISHTSHHHNLHPLPISILQSSTPKGKDPIVQRAKIRNGENTPTPRTSAVTPPCYTSSASIFCVWQITIHGIIKCLLSIFFIFFLFPQGRPWQSCTITRREITEIKKRKEWGLESVSKESM